MPELYRTKDHPNGSSELPQYEIRCGEIYRTATHDEGYINLAQYEIREGKIYRTIIMQMAIMLCHSMRLKVTKYTAPLHM